MSAQRFFFRFLLGHHPRILQTFLLAHQSLDGILEAAAQFSRAARRFRSLAAAQRRRNLRGSIGQLFALSGVTAAVSVLFIGRIGTEGRERQLLGGAMLIVGVGYAALIVSPSLLAVALVMVLIGVATGPFDVVLFTLRQRRTDPAWLGRAFAVSMSLNFVGFPVGSALGGALAPLSLEATFVIALALNVVAAVIAFVAIPATHDEQTGLR